MAEQCLRLAGGANDKVRCTHVWSGATRADHPRLLPSSCSPASASRRHRSSCLSIVPSDIALLLHCIANTDRKLSNNDQRNAV
jgi:hypothetical protein